MGYDSIVVGSGVSGLLSALALSKEGQKVLILERSEFIGGNLRTYTVDGWTVDTGVHAITHVDNGPLTKLMGDYFDLIPSFVPYGGYHVRTKDKLSLFPWTMQAWLNFDVLSQKDRLAIAQILGSSVAMKVLGSIDLSQSIYDFMSDYEFTEKTWKFIDTMSYFMSGKSMKETPVWRLMKGARYSEENESEFLTDKIMGSINSFSKLISYDGSYHQAYPRGGVGVITDAIIRSFPPGRVTVKTGETVTSITDLGEGKEVVTDKGSYTSGIVVYSGFMKQLPDLVDGLSKEYVKNLKNLQQTQSITTWIGLDERLPAFDYHGTEIWFGFDGGKHYWGMPTSNYNASFAPKDKQLVGITAILEGEKGNDEKRLMDAVETAIPGIEKHVEFTHTQVTVPEKAAITTDANFPNQACDIDGLYLVGTDTDIRSMGVTRASFSVIELINILKNKGKI